VQGASPIVDVQNVRGQTLLTREVLDTLPQGRTIQGYGALTLGTTTSAPHDVGGNKGELPGGGGGLMIHGSRNDDNQLYMDGMRYNGSFTTGGGFNRMYFVNQAAAQEVSLGTSGQGAEDEVGGVKVNIVPKEGGNLIKGTLMTNYSNGSLQADNSTDELFARGLTTGTPGLKESYDLGGGLGGPLKKDRLWYYGAVRWWGVHEYQPGAFFNKTQGSLLYTPDLDRPGFQSAYNRDTQGRLTWQASQKNKLTISESFQRNCACYRSTTATVAPEATIHLFYYPISLMQGTWSLPATNRLLFQAGISSLYNGLVSERPYDGGNNVLPILELSTGLSYNSGTGYNERIVANQVNSRFAVSYVTGSHAFKAGFTLLNADQTGTLLGVANEAIGPNGQSLGPVRYTLRNGLPNQITYFASPRGSASNRSWVRVVLRAGSVDHQQPDAQPGRALRHAQRMDARTAAAGRHVHVRGVVRESGEHPQLEGCVPAPRRCLRSVRQRPDGDQGIARPLRHRRHDRHDDGQQPDEHDRHLRDAELDRQRRLRPPGQ
jgi:hypothetical protein